MTRSSVKMLLLELVRLFFVVGKVVDHPSIHPSSDCLSTRMAVKVGVLILIFVVTLKQNNQTHDSVIEEGSREWHDAFESCSFGYGAVETWCKVCVDEMWSAARAAG